MNPKQLVLTALHLLADLGNGRTPAPTDVQILEEEFPNVSHLPLDDLCCRVIQSLSGKIFQDNVTNLISKLHSELEQLDRQVSSLKKSSTAAKTARPLLVTDDPGTA